MVECPAGKLAGSFMRFTIRDLLWLMAVVALGAGWIAREARLSIYSGTLESHIVDLELINGQCKAAVEKAGYAVYVSSDGPFLVDTKKWPATDNRPAPLNRP